MLQVQFLRYSALIFNHWLYRSHLSTSRMYHVFNIKNVFIFYFDLHGITWRVSHVRQEMLTLPEHLISPFNGGFPLFLYDLPILPMSRQAFVGNNLVLVATTWTDFFWRFYWDKASMLSYLDLCEFGFAKPKQPFISTCESNSYTCIQYMFNIYFHQINSNS